MKLLVISALLPVSFVAALGVMVWTSVSPSLLDGEIVMEKASYCDLFVIETGQGWALARDETSWPVVVSSGLNVSGLRREVGAQTIVVDSRAELRIRVILWQSNLSLAQARFEQECNPSTPGRSFEMQSSRSVW